MSFSFEWDVTPEAAFGQLTTVYVARIRQGVRAIARRRAPEIAAWMKANHLWQNRTGAAEAGLNTTMEDVALDMVQIVLAHGADVPYGVYLELARSGMWGVIAPAIDIWGPVVWEDVRAMLG
jgi:hypothetical protein